MRRQEKWSRLQNKSAKTVFATNPAIIRMGKYSAKEDWLLSKSTSWDVNLSCAMFLKMHNTTDFKSIGGLCWIFQSFHFSSQSRSNIKIVLIGGKIVTPVDTAVGLPSPILAFRPSLSCLWLAVDRSFEPNTGLSLVNASHVTWILASDWSNPFFWIYIYSEELAGL